MAMAIKTLSCLDELAIIRWQSLAEDKAWEWVEHRSSSLIWQSIPVDVGYYWSETRLVLKPLKMTSMSSLVFFAKNFDYATEIHWDNVTFSSCLSYLKEDHLFLYFKIYVLHCSEWNFIPMIAQLYTGQCALQLLIEFRLLCIDNNASPIPVILRERTCWHFK